MTTTNPTPDIPFPPGADPDYTEGWEPAENGKSAYRLVWSKPFDAITRIRAVVVQYADGTVATEGDDAPLVYLGSDDFLPDDARAIAQTLVDAADLADKWAGR